MDFVISNLGTNESLPGEQFFPHFLTSLLRTHSSVQLAEVHLYRIYFLQNPYFSSTVAYKTKWA